MSILNTINETFTAEKNKNFDKGGFVMKIVIFCILISILLFSLGLFAGYYRDDIKSPAGDEHSVPAPKTY
jgi:hypothetical protein